MTTQEQQQQQATKRPAIKWLVPLPENDPYGDRAFRVACRGNSDLGEALNYFMYAASQEVEQNKGLDISCGTVTIKRLLDTIVKHLKVSKKTAIARIGKLVEWEFITAHGYHHRYNVHFKKVAEAIKNPPAPEKPKLRGRHAVKTTILTIPPLSGENEGKDCTDLPLERDKRIEGLEARIVDLQSQIVTLTSWIVDLQSEMVKLQSLQSPEQAPEGMGKAQIDPLTITNHYLTITEQSVCSETLQESQPSADHTHTASSLPVGDFEQDGITNLEEEPANEASPRAEPSAVPALPAADALSSGADGRVSPPAVMGQSVASVPPGNGSPAQPPARSKAPVIPIAAMRLLDDWDREYGPSGRPRWVVDAAIDIVSRLAGDIGKVMRVVEKIEAKKLNRSGKPLNLEFVANHWGLLTERQPPARPANAPNIGRDGKTDLNVYGIDALLRRQERRGPLFTQEELEAAAAALGEAI